MGAPSALRAFRSVCKSCRSASSIIPTPASVRPFSQSTCALAKSKDLGSTLANVDQSFARASSLGSYGSIIPSQDGAFKNLVEQEWAADDRHHLHIYSTKHNTHITLTKPNRDALLSVSCGNIGFRKAGRGSYDAAYQLAAFVMTRVQDKGWLRAVNGKEGDRIQKIELVYRGFGQGREAVTKAILGNEGRHIRPLINKLSDSTRLKFGGTRSKKPRRLG